MGTRRLDLLNRALLGKWVWRLVYKSKYGTEDGFGHGVGLGKTIAKESDQLKKDRVFIVVDGRKIRLWEDFWCGSRSLFVAFPILYIIAGNKGAKVADLWVRQSGGGAWDPKFLRPFNDWELDAIQEFIGLTSNIKISSLEKDKLIWKGDDSSCFTVKGYFN